MLHYMLREDIPSYYAFTLPASGCISYMKMADFWLSLISIMVPAGTKYDLSEEEMLNVLAREYSGFGWKHQSIKYFILKKLSDDSPNPKYHICTNRIWHFLILNIKTAHSKQQVFSLPQVMAIEKLFCTYGTQVTKL